MPSAASATASSAVATTLVLCFCMSDISCSFARWTGTQLCFCGSFRGEGQRLCLAPPLPLPPLPLGHWATILGLESAVLPFWPFSFSVALWVPLQMLVEF